MSAVFKNVNAALDGYSFDSRLEASVYAILKRRQATGEIKEIQPQCHIRICGPVGHECPTHGKIESVVDFRCVKADGSELFIEAKGFANQTWPIKKRLWRHYGRAPLELWGGTAQRPVLMETIYPVGSE